MAMGIAVGIGFMLGRFFLPFQHGGAIGAFVVLAFYLIYDHFAGTFKQESLNLDDRDEDSDSSNR